MGCVGNDDAEPTTTERKRVANFDCFDTEPFDSQLSRASSPCGKYDDKGDAKWQYSASTPLINDNTPVEHALETQLVILSGETQPLDVLDGDEDVHTQLLDEIGEGVVFDSDGEGTDRTQVLEDVDELSADDAHYGGSGQSANTNEIQCEPSCGHVKRKLLVQTDAIIDEQTSSAPPRFTFLCAESLREAALAVHNMALKQTKGETRSHEPPAVKDREPGGSDKNKSKFASSVMRKLFSDGLLAEEKGASLGSNDVNEGEDLSKSPVYDGHVAGLSYVDSQEPGELSQANALDFVDRFLEDNVIDSDQEAKYVTKVPEKSKPLPRPSTKGQQSLAQRANVRGKAGKTGIYDWDDSHEDEGVGDIFRRRKDKFFKDEICRRKSLPAVSNIKVSKSNAHGDGEEQLCISDKIMNAVHSDSRLMSPNLKTKDHTAQETATKSRRKLDNGLDKQFNINSSRGELEPNAMAEDAQEMIGVGLDTQMAAEAMEALCNGEGIVDQDADDATRATRSSLTDPPNCSSAGNTRALSSKESSRQYARKRKLNVKSDLQISSSSKGYAKEGKQLCKKDNLMKKSNRSNLNAEDNLTSTASENRSNLPSHSVKQRKSIGDSKTHQVEELNNCTGSVRGSGLRSVNKRCLHDGYFTPIASRTRQSLVVNQPVKPDRPSRSFRGDDKGVGSFEKRNSSSSIQASKSLDLKSTILCSDYFGVDENTKMSELEKSASKFSSVNNGSMVDTLEVPRRRRSLRKLSCHNKGSELGGSSKSFAQSEDIGNSNANKRKKLTEAKILAKSNMNGQTQPSSCSRSIISSVYQKQGQKLEPILDQSNPGDTSVCCSVIDKDANLNSTGKNDADFLSSAKNFDDSRLDELPRERCKTSNLASSTSANFKTTVNDASPVFMGDKYYKQSCNRNISRSLRELRILSAAQPETTTSSKDSRKRRDITDVQVLFSHHLDEDIIKHQKKILLRLGASLASSISDATHFIADEFVRTQNMLEAIASGKPVVSHLWIESCGQARCFIDEKNYILRDAKKEKEIGFAMPVSLARASQCPLLEGQRVFITPNAKPSKEIVSSLVKAVQGQAVERIGRSALKDEKIPDDLLVLSCEEDYAFCMPFLKKGAAIYSSELLLNGIVTQKLEYERHRLFGGHVKKARSTIRSKRDVRTLLPVTKCN